jgi:hypothetical protein
MQVRQNDALIVPASNGGRAPEILGSVFATPAQQTSEALSFLSGVIWLPANQRSHPIHQLLPLPRN